MVYQDLLWHIEALHLQELTIAAGIIVRMESRRHWRIYHSSIRYVLLTKSHNNLKSSRYESGILERHPKYTLPRLGLGYLRKTEHELCHRRGFTLVVPSGIEALSDALYFIYAVIYGKFSSIRQRWYTTDTLAVIGTLSFWNTGLSEPLIASLFWKMLCIFATFGHVVKFGETFDHLVRAILIVHAVKFKLYFFNPRSHYGI